MAIGHKVIALLLLSLFEHRAEHNVAHERHCERVEAEVQTNSDHFGTAKEASASLVERASSNGPFRRELRPTGF
jgi:hypothetical protein